MLVLPVEHYPSGLSLGSSTYEEVERYLSALRSCYAAAGGVLHQPFGRAGLVAGGSTSRLGAAAAPWQVGF